MDAFNPFSSRDAAVQKLWEQWQPRSAKSDKDKPIALADFDPGAKPFSNGNGKTEDKAAVEALAEEIDALQNLLYADRRYKLLVVLQGTDTAGKDGTIRGVFGRTSALGMNAVGWKAPTDAERAHDYLWAHPPARAGRRRDHGLQPQPL